MDTHEQSIPVLVVGDWLVDEHWVVGKHRSATSSRTGSDHSRALHAETCSVRSLCGAGQVATILHQAHWQGATLFDVIGVGIWHPEDSKALAAMLDPEFNVGRTPHRLSGDLHSREIGDVPFVELYNLAGTPNQRVVDAGTTRVIRIYQNTPRGMALRQRLDWELPLSDAALRNMYSGIQTTLAGLWKKREEVRHILVKDLRKGAVDKKLVEALHHAFPAARWYISSKEWHPEWLNVLKKKDHIELLIAPPIAAQRAINRGELSSWLTVGGEPSQEALAAMERLADEFGIRRIVIHPDETTIVAHEAGDPPRGLTLPSNPTGDTVPFTPMASVFFPALFTQLVTREWRDKKQSFLSMLQQAVAFTEQWQAEERQRLTRDDWKPGRQQVLILDAAPPTVPQRWREYDWGEATDRWTKALSELGVIEIPDAGRPNGIRYEFQLWRGMTELGDYIACKPEKRLALNRIYRDGRALGKTPLDERRHKSFLIVDQPGSGKSFMVECLRKALRLESRHYNITRFHSRNDLFDCFQEIAGYQSDTQSPLLIFFDELNAKVAGHHIYDAFLEPLEDGKFVRGGSASRIAPSLWIFAGTEEPTASSASDKGQDLEQRLSGPVFHFREASQTRESDITKTERVYVGVSCLLQRFPEVNRVSPQVLQAFWMMTGAVPREVRRFVWDFDDVQYSRVMGHNLPRDHQRKYPHLNSNQRRADDENLLVEIKRRPAE